MRRISALAIVALSFLAVQAGPSIADSAARPAAASAEPMNREATKGAAKLGPNEVAIYIGDMHCNNCAKKIAAKLYRVKGVVKVRTSVKDNLAIVTPQAKKQVDVKAAWAAVAKAGFEPTKLISPHGTFVADEKTKAPRKAPDSETGESAK